MIMNSVTSTKLITIYRRFSMQCWRGTFGVNCGDHETACHLHNNTQLPSRVTTNTTCQINHKYRMCRMLCWNKTRCNLWRFGGYHFTKGRAHGMIFSLGFMLNILKNTSPVVTAALLVCLEYIWNETNLRFCSLFTSSMYPRCHQYFIAFIITAFPQ